MNPKCFVPDLKIFLHEQFVVFLNEGRNTLINMEVSLCGHCNAGCDFCFYKDEKEKIEIDSERLIDFLAACQSYGLQAVTWTGGGEPTLHNKFSYIVEKAKDLGLVQGLFTNAIGKINYNADVFDWIRISKTNNPLPVANIAELSKNAKKLGIAINYKNQKDDEDVYFALNVAEAFDNIKYVQVRPMLATKGEYCEVEIPDFQPKYSKHPKLFVTKYKFDEARKPKQYSECYGYHFVPFLWHNGDFGPCGYQKDMVFGNIYTDNHIDIIKNMPHSIDVRKDCQVCCKNSLINKSISDALSIEDINFV